MVFKLLTSNPFTSLKDQNHHEMRNCPYDSIFEKHQTGLGHPEQKNRASFIFEKIKANLLQQTESIPIRECPIERTIPWLMITHYLQSSKKEIELGLSLPKYRRHCNLRTNMESRFYGNGRSSQCSG